MRKFRQRSKPSSPPDAEQTNSPQHWLTVSQIIKVLVGSGVLLFLCNLGYDAAKATILRRMQLEAENKQLRTQLERIDHKILPKIEQAHLDVKDIQQPLQQEKLTNAQLEQLALKARGVCETLEEIEYMLKLTTIAKAEHKKEEWELADILIGLPNTAQAATLNDKKRRSSKRTMKRNETNQRSYLSNQKKYNNEERISEKRLQDNSPAPNSNNPQQMVDADAPLILPNPMGMARNLSFLGLPMLPTSRKAADIRRVILQHKASIQDCYTRVLKDHPAINGEIKVRLTISPNGKVMSAALLASTVNHAELERLILEKIIRWNDFGEVSPIVGNVTFKQTFILGEEKLASRD